MDSDEGASGYDQVKPFVRKTWSIMNNMAHADIISWMEGSDGKWSVVVWKPDELAAKILPEHFKMSQFCSFVRQVGGSGKWPRLTLRSSRRTVL